MAEQAQRARKRIAQNRRADVADVHRLGHVGRTEINDHGPRASRFLEEQMFAPRGRFQRLCERGGVEPEIQKTCAGDFDRFAPLGDIKGRDHIRGQLAWVHLARLGQRHQRVDLVIAELRVGTWPDQAQS